MTAHKHLKERIRARMARTGELHQRAAARPQRPPAGLLPAPRRGPPGHPRDRRGAGQPGPARPHTGQPLSEAMVLGAGGGLGAGYILWEFKAHDRGRWSSGSATAGSTRTAGR